MLITAPLVRPAFPAVGDAALRGGAVHRTPVSFGGCFGWLHVPARPRVIGSTSDFAVVLCPAIGPEARWSHRTLRKLADQTAAAGRPVLRFDYPGTGNARDLLDGEEALAAWRDSVHAAVDQVRERTGAGQVALIGLRFGALLAAEVAAARWDVAALGLLAPVVSGRGYARDLRVMAKAARHPAPGPAGGLELDGTPLPDATLRALAGLSLSATVEAGPHHVLLLDLADQAASHAAALRACGVAVTDALFAGYGALMCCATENQVPYAELARVAAWLDTLPAAPGPAATPAQAPARAASGAVTHLPGCVEQPLRFGPGGSLFGMLCRPREGAIPEFALLVGNTGGDPSHGIGRFGVALARHLARNGMATLRLDFAGLGDSLRGADEDGGHVFETDRTADVGAALDALSALGVRRFGITGICSGAYHALRAASADPRIEAAALVNLATFAWAPVGEEDPVLANNSRSTRFYLERLRRAGTWRRLLRSQVDVCGVARVLAGRLRRRAALGATRLLARFSAQGGTGASPSPKATLQALSARGTRMLLLHGFDDPSVDTLEEQFGPGGHRLAGMPGIAVRIERDLDHNLTTRPMRDRVAGILLGFLGNAARPGV